jgi:hypothetical protein
MKYLLAALATIAITLPAQAQKGYTPLQDSGDTRFFLLDASVKPFNRLAKEVRFDVYAAIVNPKVGALDLAYSVMGYSASCVSGTIKPTSTAGYNASHQQIYFDRDTNNSALGDDSVPGKARDIACKRLKF